jgi:hypothetical protein
MPTLKFLSRSEGIFHNCGVPNVSQDAIERWLLLTKEEEWLGDDLFSAMEHFYIEGIDWAESICAGLAAVLSLSPGHQRAIEWKEGMEKALAKFDKDAENLFASAESKSYGDQSRQTSSERTSGSRRLRHVSAFSVNARCPSSRTTPSGQCR